MIGGIEAIESDAEAGVDWREEDVDCERREKWRTKEARERRVFVLQLNLVADREARF